MPPSETAQRWADRLQRFDQAGTTVAKFCQAEGISQPSYYHWRRKLRGPARPIHVVSEPAFLPVQLAAASADEQSKLSRIQPSRPRSIATTTIDLPGGVRIRIEVPANDSLASGEESKR